MNTPRQFSIFRILFGCYLIAHFAALVPHANELFGSTGVIRDPAMNPAHGLFPNPLDAALPAAAVTGFVVALVLLSIGFAADVARPFVSLVLWFGWTALFHRNNLIANPSLPYVGLLLVLCALVPTGKGWTMPVWIPRCAWILLATGYSFSGLTKLGSPSWLDGSAIARLLDNPLARPGWARDILLGAPWALPAILTWGTLVLEIIFAPLALWRGARPWLWLAMTLMHAGILLVVDFADLSLGMLMIHLFVFEPEWLGTAYRLPWFGSADQRGPGNRQVSSTAERSGGTGERTRSGFPDTGCWRSMRDAWRKIRLRPISFLAQRLRAKSP